MGLPRKLAIRSPYLHHKLDSTQSPPKRGVIRVRCRCRTSCGVALSPPPPRGSSRHHDTSKVFTPSWDMVGARAESEELLLLRAPFPTCLHADSRCSLARPLFFSTTYSHCPPTTTLRDAPQTRRILLLWSGRGVGLQMHRYDRCVSRREREKRDETHSRRGVSARSRKTPAPKCRAWIRRPTFVAGFPSSLPRRDEWC